MKAFNVYGGAMISSWVLVALVILVELVGPFKTLLKTLFWHHWVGKAVLVTLVFVIAGLAYPEENSHEKKAWKSVIGSLVVIFLFMLFIIFLRGE